MEGISMRESHRAFDGVAFFKALESTMIARSLNWKEVSKTTGVGASTLSRMAQGRGPDAGSLAVLAAWAGLNPGEFTNEGRKQVGKPEPLALLTTRLRDDPKLTPEAVSVLDQVIKATYRSLMKSDSE
jgi:transcriptional regulator with XRE-family HTH domain